MYAKTSAFETDLQELAKIAKVLSHPARLAILRLLAESKTCISGDIAEQLPLSRTTVSQHLQELKKIGLIQGEIDGLKVCYCIDYEIFDKYEALFQTFFETINTPEEQTISCV